MISSLAWAFALWIASHSSSKPQVLGLWSRSYFGLVAASFAFALLLTSAHAMPVYSRLYLARHRLLALFIAAVCILGALEGLTRLLDPLGISYYEASKRYHLDNIADPDLVYRHRPHFNGTYSGVGYSYNEIGLRERPIGPKAADEFRVLVLGDSVALGLGVKAEETFVRLLEGLLSNRRDHPVRTINAGVGSYNTTLELRFLELRGEEIDPDLVVLAYVENDIELNLPPFDPWGTLSLRGKSPPEAIERILWHSWFYRLGAHVVRRTRARAPVPDRSADGWRESMARVGDIADLCGRRGVRLAVFLWRVRASPVTDALWGDLSTIARRKGFPLCDMQPAFAAADPGSVTISPVDAHANAQGHRLAATMMDEFLWACDAPGTR